MWLLSLLQEPSVLPPPAVQGVNLVLDTATAAGLIAIATALVKSARAARGVTERRKPDFTAEDRAQLAHLIRSMDKLVDRMDRLMERVWGRSQSD